MSPGEAAADAIERLFSLYGDDIYRFVRYSLGADSRAEDIVQDIFLGALRNWDRFAGRASERSWLFSIARRRIADSLRAAGREARRASGEHPAEDAVLKTHEDRLDLERSLRLLPLPQRQVFVLRIVEDRPVEETAEILGRSPVWVRVNLHRALGRLRAALAPGQETARREGESL